VGIKEKRRSKKMERKLRRLMGSGGQGPKVAVQFKRLGRRGFTRRRRGGRGGRTQGFTYTNT
jgi:hypothetical protein